MEIAALVKQNNGYAIQSKPELNAKNAQQIIFMIAGPDADVIRAALQKIQIAASDIDAGTVKHQEPSEGLSYVYGYFEAGRPQSWQTAFYIGKGRNSRLFAHLNERVLIRDNEDATVATRQKGRMIDQWLELNADQTQTRRSARAHAIHSKHISCLYSGLTELEAFYLEKFLIMRARRPQHIANDTAGNHESGEYSSICQPREYKPTNKVHNQLWHQTVEGFLTDPTSPRIKNTLRPALTFIGLEPELDALVETLASVGVVPCDMTHAPENRLDAQTMIRTYCGVHGAGDAKVSFRLADADRPYRFDFRIPPGGLGLIITLRPIVCTSEANQAFRNFLDSVSLTESTVGTCTSIAQRLSDLYPSEHIKNRRQWPFYKPFTWNANAKQYDPAYFPVTAPDTRVPIKTNWIQGHEAELSMLEAIELIAKSFK